MIPGKYDLALYRGDTWGMAVYLWEDAGKTEPTDLTDATAAAQIRDAPGGGNATDLIVDIVPPNIVVVAIPAELWPTLTLKKGAWDLQLTFAAGNVVQTVLAGSVAVTQDVTDLIGVGP